jgi:hypothetical protein
VHLEAELAAALRELFSTVIGSDDGEIWPVQVDVARGVLAAGGIGADELAEWAAVQRHREAGNTSTDLAPPSTPDVLPQSPE